MGIVYHGIQTDSATLYHDPAKLPSLVMVVVVVGHGLISRAEDRPDKRRL